MRGFCRKRAKWAGMPAFESACRLYHRGEQGKKSGCLSKCCPHARPPFFSHNACFWHYCRPLHSFPCSMFQAAAFQELEVPADLILECAEQAEIKRDVLLDRKPLAPKA